MPGIINADTGFAIHGGSLEFIRQMNRIEFYKTLFKLPVSVDNDARCAIIGEMNSGKLKKISNGIMIVLGTGFGGGLLINGQIVRGAHQSAGEFSFIQTNKSMIPTDFFALKNSVYSLLEPFAKSLDKTVTEVNGKEFFESVEIGNSSAQSILEDYCRSLAVQLWNLQAILDPEMIVIGGGISRQTIFLDYLKRALQIDLEDERMRLLSKVISPYVVLSSLGNDANLIGAYHNFLKRNEF